MFFSLFRLTGTIDTGVLQQRWKLIPVKTGSFPSGGQIVQDGPDVIRDLERFEAVEIDHDHGSLEQFLGSAHGGRLGEIRPAGQLEAIRLDDAARDAPRRPVEVDLRVPHPVEQPDVAVSPAQRDRRVRRGVEVDEGTP